MSSKYFGNSKQKLDTKDTTKNSKNLRTNSPKQSNTKKSGRGK